jgi:hypothetical protein
MTATGKRFSWSALYEVPLSVASLALFIATRGILQRLLNRYHKRNAAHALRWQLLSGEFLARPGVLPIFLTTAPRWNTHAVIATAGPVDVKEELAVWSDTARRSSSEWFFVLYSYPRRATVGMVSCLFANDSGWLSFKLPGPGRYLVGARYYGTKDAAEFPALRIDGVENVPSAAAPSDTNRFYDSLALRGNLFFACLSYHVYPILKFQWVKKSWIERMFLPVGNPETLFLYGTIEAGQRLNCRMDLSRFGTHRYFVTIYSRVSLPVLWYEVRADTQGAGPASPAQGYYLIRLQPTRGGLSPFDPRERDGLVSVLQA